MIALDAAGFKVVVPWVFAVPTHRMLGMLSAEKPVEQFALSLSEFLEVLPIEDMDRFDTLDFSEAVKVISQWMERSMAMKEFIDNPD